MTASAVHTVVARLRRRHGGALVRTTDAGYLVPLEVATDADPSRGRRLGRRPRCERVREALELWVGDTAYGAARQRARRAHPPRRVHRRARADLATVLLGAGREADALEALALARALVVADPLDEAAAVLAMQAAYRRGRQGEALEVYDTCAARCATSRGLPAVRSASCTPASSPTTPPSATRRAHLRARRRRVGDNPRTRATPCTPVGSCPSPPLPRWAARPTWPRSSTRWPTGGGSSRSPDPVGWGSPGSSPTSAPRSARKARWSTSRWAPSGAGGREPAAGVAVTTGVPLDGDDQVAGLVAALRFATATVLADEAEWVLESAAELAAALLAGCPGLRVVVTSRIPLSVVGERVVELAPLPTGPEGPTRRLRLPRGPDPRRAPRRPGQDPPTPRLTEAELRVLGGWPAASTACRSPSSSSPGPGPEPLGDLFEWPRHPLDLAAYERGRPTATSRCATPSPGGWSGSTPTPASSCAGSASSSDPSRPRPRAVVGPGAADVERAVRVPARHNLLRVERTATRLSFRMLRIVRDLALDELADAGESTPAAGGTGGGSPGSGATPAVRRPRRARRPHPRRPPRGPRRRPGPPRRPRRRRPRPRLTRRWQLVETIATGLRWTTRLLVRPGITPVQRARLRVSRAGFLQGADWARPSTSGCAPTSPTTPSGRPARARQRDHRVRLGRPREGAARIDDALEAAARAPYLLPEVVAAAAVFDATEGDRRPR